MSDQIHPRAIEPDNLPATTDALPEPSRNADIIYNLRLLFAQMDDRRAELAKAGDVESLAHGAADVDLLASELSTIKRSAQADIAKIFAETGERKREVPNLGIVEVKGGFDRKNWQSRKLLNRIIMEAILDTETGEFFTTEPAEVASAIETAISTVLGMTGSTSWKVGEKSADGTYKGGLRSIGIDPEDYCDEVEKPRLATIPKRKATT
jgi:hypothetical protein